MCDGLKDEFYKLSQIKEVSQNLKHLGQDWNIPMLEQEAAKNEKNPGRAIGKAAQAYLTWMAGSGLGDAAGAAGEAGTGAAVAGSAANAAANAFPAALSSMPISELAQLATKSPELAQGLMGAVETAAPQAATNSMQMGNGLFGSLKSGMGGLMDGMKAIPARMGEGFNTLLDGSVPAGMPNTMESALVDTGYTPSSLKMAFQNTEGTPLSQNLMNYGKQGLRNGLGAYSKGSGNKFADEMAMKMGMGMMSPQQPQQPMPQSRPFQQGPMEPLPNPYGEGLLNSMDGPPPGMTLEEWEKLKRLKQQGLMGRM